MLIYRKFWLEMKNTAIAYVTMSLTDGFDAICLIPIRFEKGLICNLTEPVDRMLAHSMPACGKRRLKGLIMLYNVVDRH
jgi:hypothetical protein